EFKDSELGEIPVGWAADKLNSHASKVGSGITPKGGSDAYLSAGIPLIRSQNVLVGRLSLEDVVFIAREQHEKMRNSELVPNDVLLNITG
ncbi:restriction endonuclease subunit S, partial [Acinetobacter baumannii]